MINMKNNKYSNNISDLNYKLYDYLINYDKSNTQHVGFIKIKAVTSLLYYVTVLPKIVIINYNEKQYIQLM